MPAVSRTASAFPASRAPFSPMPRSRSFPKHTPVALAPSGPPPPPARFRPAACRAASFGGSARSASLSCPDRAFAPRWTQCSEAPSQARSTSQLGNLRHSAQRACRTRTLVASGRGTAGDPSLLKTWSRTSDFPAWRDGTTTLPCLLWWSAPQGPPTANTPAGTPAPAPDHQRRVRACTHRRRSLPPTVRSFMRCHRGTSAYSAV
jgi:hypothetical protein